ncbi:MAG: LysM peptidoglycan-binding domain-containing protein [Blastocatellia bacterium]|nr:LysM peptidoglycan-binding domain-containing protein [Blastocatellia bacterium]
MEIYIPQVSANIANSEASAQTYTVQPGDTLESIAAQFGVGLEQLIAANFKDGMPGQISAGQELKIPLGDGLQGFITYVVQEGDTADNIASKFGILTMDLIRANPLLLKNPLLPGSDVKVPQFISTEKNTQAKASEQLLPQTYTMKLGDSLREIAKGHNIPLSDLEKVNSHITDSTKSFPGEVIKFPTNIVSSRTNNIQLPVQTRGNERALNEKGFPADNLSKLRFQMIESQVPGFGLQQALPREEEEFEQQRPQKRDRKHAVPPPFDEWVDFIYASSEKYDLSPSLIAAIIWRESGGRNYINGSKHGLMHIDYRRYSDWLQSHKLGLDPESNIDFGSSILRSCLDRFKGDKKLALSAYSIGVEPVELALQQGRPVEPLTPGGNYAFDVLSQQENLRKFFED